MKICIICGKEFKPAVHHQITCCIECRKIYNRQKAAEKWHEQHAHANIKHTHCVKARCKSCYYRRRVSTGNQHSGTACHYILDTGVQRGCPPENCDKYKPRGRKREQIPQY